MLPINTNKVPTICEIEVVYFNFTYSQSSRVTLIALVCSTWCGCGSCWWSLCVQSHEWLQQKPSQESLARWANAVWRCRDTQGCHCLYVSAGSVLVAILLKCCVLPWVQCVTSGSGQSVWRQQHGSGCGMGSCTYYIQSQVLRQIAPEPEPGSENTALQIVKGFKLEIIHCRVASVCTDPRPWICTCFFFLLFCSSSLLTPPTYPTQ